MRHGEMPQYAALLVFGCAAAVVTLACASSVRTPSVTAGCSVVVRPGEGLERTVKAAKPGDTICLRTGDYDVNRLPIRTSGAAGARITLRSATPKRPATIHGV